MIVLILNMATLHVKDENFKSEVMDSSVPVLVDFWAPWCGPCKMIAPIIDECAKEYSGKLKVAKLNVDECPKTASQFGIMSIPTLIFFKQGKVMAQAVGALSKAELKRRIEEHIA